MFSKFHTISISALGTLMVSGACLPAQQQQAPETPRAELFVGYSYLRATPTLADGNRLVNLNGGSTSLAFNVNRYLGLVTDFGGFNDTQLRLSGPGANPTRVVDADATAYTFLFGPRLSYRRHEHFTPFAQVLAGGIYAGAVTIRNCTTAPCVPLPEQGSFALTAGGGFDIKLAKRVSLRAVQAEYLMTRFANTSTGVRGTQNDIRLSSGLLFRFGGLRALPMATNHLPVVVCSAARSTVYAGQSEALPLHAKAVDSDGDPLTYRWTVASGTITSNGPDAQWQLASAEPGTYAAMAHVEDGHNGAADCSVDVVVERRPNQAPSLSCIADRSSALPGGSVSIKAVAVDADNDALSYAWTTTGGRIVGSGNAVSLQIPSGAGASYTVSGHVEDGHGGQADCTVTVAAEVPAEIVTIGKRLALHSIYFPTAEPTATHPNEGLLASQRKTLTALASDFSRYLTASPDADLILEGHADPRGSVEYNQELSSRRVESTKHFLVKQGIPAEHIKAKALGEASNLSDAEVKAAIDGASGLSATERDRLTSNLATIALASNRRVDVVLSTTLQQSARQYPFNASDSLTLLSERKPGGKAKASVHKR